MNSSTACVGAFIRVTITISIPMPANEFTSFAQEKFLTALALSADVPIKQVSILDFNLARRIISSNTSTLVRASIAVNDAAQAQSVTYRVGLGVNLTSQGLPQGTLVSVESMLVRAPSPSPVSYTHLTLPTKRIV